MDIVAPAKKRGFSFDGFSAWMLALAVPLAIVFFIPSTTVPLVSTKIGILVLAVALTFVAFAIARLSHGSLSLPPLVLLGSFWLIPVAYGLSTLFSGVSFDHALLGVEMEVDTLGFVTLLAVLATLGAFVFREAKEYKRFFTLFVGAISLAFVAQIGIIIASKMMSTFPASTNLVGSFTDFSIVTGAGMILALLSLRFLRLSTLLRIGLYVFMVLGFLVLVIANSNTVFVLVGLVSGALFIEAVLARKLPEQMHLTSTGGNPHARLGSVGHGAKLILPLLCLIVSLFFVFVDVEKQDKVHTEHLGIPNLTVLFATNSAARVETMLQHVRDNVHPDYQHKFLFKSFKGFSTPWRVPSELLPVFEPWKSVNGEVNIHKK